MKIKRSRILTFAFVAMLAGVVTSLAIIEKTEIVVIACTLSVSIPLLLWMIFEGLGYVYQPIGGKNINNFSNQEDEGLIPFVFIDNYYRNFYNITSKIAMLFSLFKQEIREIPVDHVGVLTVEGKIVAYFKKGGPYIYNPVFKIESRSNKNIEILFNRNGSTGSDFAIGTATPNQSDSYKEDFIRMYSVAIARKMQTNEEKERNDEVVVTDENKTEAGEVWDKEGKDAIMNSQVTLFPEINLVLEIEIDTDDWQKNIEKFWKNVRGENEEERLKYITSQMVANTKAVLNEIFKKFTYGQLAALLRVGAMSYKLLRKVEKLNENQELGLNIRTASVAALHAPQNVHDAQMAVSISQAKQFQGKIDAETNLNTVKKKSDGEAYDIEVKGKAEADKNKLLNTAAAMLTEMDLLAKAKGAKEMNNVEIEALENLLKTATANNVDAKIIIDAEYALEQAKQYAGAKGTIIIKDHGNVTSPNNSGTGDNSVSTVLIVQALKEVAEALKHRP